MERKMEDVILDAIDDLSSKDEVVFGSGLVKVDSLLGAICKPSTSTAMESGRSRSSTRRHTTQLMGRPEVKEFLLLQDSFMFNLVSRIALRLDLEDEDRLIMALNIVQGLCLLHHPSRKVFGNAVVMKKLIGLISVNSPHASLKVYVAAINTVMSVMVRNVENIRQFESCDGLRVVCDLFKSKDTPKDVKMEILEFLFFYLIPETGQREKVGRLNTEEKSRLLSKYLSNVNGLVKELKTSTPFGDMDLEW
ncbi:hypothetical protein TRVA0_038S00716 [Trichomonascus vanleenenianus]|uniref:uncharacterized protein n=1 Tax=Trichomonascus vanleenenianus TaxID=2268995 RepID=UPI003ECB5BA8